METRKLGKSTLAITPLMLGGNVLGWTADEPTSFAVLDAFVAHGGNCDRHGRRLFVVGAGPQRRRERDRDRQVAQAQRQARHGRDRHEGGLLATRRASRATTSSPGARIRYAGSASRRSTLLAAQGRRQDAARRILGALDELVEAGKVRAVGASNFAAPRFAEALGRERRSGKVRFAAQQPEYNLMNRDIEKELMPLCAARARSIVPYFGLASGF